MKNFNVYDPMTRGQGLVLDGQTLAHLEVSCSDLCFKDIDDALFRRSYLTMRVQMKVLY